MGWEFWSDTQRQIDAALDFINRGTVASNPLPIPGTNRRGCFDSSDCASGWACVKGYCVQEDTGAGEGSYGDPTGCGGGEGGGGGGASCGPSPASSGCTKSGCGDPEDADDCCGDERCCRISAFGVRCYCGPCPPLDDCNVFCDNYKKANGESAAGCTDENGCDECSSCVTSPDGLSSRCEEGGGPCWCNDSSCSGICQKCGDDGSCELDCGNCKQCYTIYNYPCECGAFTIKCCYDYCENTKGYPECYAEAAKKCEELCQPPDYPLDPCAGDCETKTYCDQDPPPCPPKTSCSTVGSISAGGKNCTLIQECDKSNIPDSCFPCDCNCDNDCPECYFCNAAGKCQKIPACDDFEDTIPPIQPGTYEVVVYDTQNNEIVTGGLLGSPGSRPADEPFRMLSRPGWNTSTSNPTLQWYQQYVFTHPLTNEEQIATACVRPSIFDSPRNCNAYPTPRYEGRIIYTPPDGPSGFL